MRFRPKVAVQALHHCLGRSGSPTMDARRAFLAIAVACAAAQRWCDANLFAPPRPAHGPAGGGYLPAALAFLALLPAV